MKAKGEQNFVAPQIFFNILNKMEKKIAHSSIFLEDPKH